MDTYDLGSKKHVFIDWDLIEPGYAVSGDGRPESWEMPYGVRLAAHKPRREPQKLIQPDKPWEGLSNGHVTLFEDEGRYRMYYLRSGGSGLIYRGDNGPAGGIVCYAESADGVTWTKPNLGLFDFEGSKENNLVFALEKAPVRSPAVFKDPSAQPEQRYKMVYRSSENGQSTVHGAVSADGLHWEILERPLGHFFTDTQIVVRFDQEKGRYIGYFRGRAGGRRTIAYAETDRFESWPVPETIVAPDMHDSPDTDIYTNAYTPWPDAQAHLMFPAFFRRGLDTFEVTMMTSGDEVRWQRPTRVPILTSGEPGSEREGLIYACKGLVSVRPGEWSIPFSQNPISHNRARSLDELAKVQHRGYVGLATWRQDGFMSLEAETEGRCATVPSTFSGSQLEVNAWTRYGGEIRVELADASKETGGGRVPAEAIASRTFEDCDPITGDHLKRTVTWKGESDLSAWTGQPVRLRLQMRRARLYAIKFV